MATAVSIGIALLFIAVTAIWWIDDLFGGLLLVIGWVMAEAARLAEENRQYI